MHGLEGLFPPQASVEVENCNPQLLPDPTHLLWPQERAVIARSVEKRRREFAAGRFLGRRVLQRLGFAELPIPVRLDRAPEWPRGVVGSISHTEALCVVCAARSCDALGLGVDVELREGLDASLTKLVCTPTELEVLDALNPHARAALGKIIFSAKESLYKAQYALTAEFLDFSAVSVEVDPHSSSWYATFNVKAGEAFAPGDTVCGRYLENGGFIATGLALTP